MIQAVNAPFTDEPVTSDDHTMALLSHVGGYFTSFVLPLIFWLVYKDKSRFVAQHARESLNFQISQIIYFVVVSSLAVGLYIAMGVLIGWDSALLPTLGVYLLIGSGFAIFELVAVIFASVAGYQGRSFRYPLCIRGV